VNGPILRFLRSARDGGNDPAQAECPVPRHFVNQVPGLDTELGRGTLVTFMQFGSIAFET